MEQIEFEFEYTRHYEIKKVDEVKESICDKVNEQMQDIEPWQSYWIIDFHNHK